MSLQAELYGAEIRRSKVTALRKVGNLFIADFNGCELRARSVLLATGVVNRKPQMAPKLHDEAVEKGLLRYCPICDGYEITDKRVGVIGSGTKGFNEAVFLRSFTKDVTLVAPDGALRLSRQEETRLADVEIRVDPGPISLIAHTKAQSA